MPMAARVFASIVGLGLIAFCVVIFVMARPLSWPVVSLGIGAGFLGGELLQGGLRGKWPVWALLWLVP